MPTPKRVGVFELMIECQSQQTVTGQKNHSEFLEKLNNRFLYGTHYWELDCRTSPLACCGGLQQLKKSTTHSTAQHARPTMSSMEVGASFVSDDDDDGPVRAELS